MPFALFSLILLTGNKKLHATLPGVERWWMAVLREATNRRGNTVKGLACGGGFSCNEAEFVYKGLLKPSSWQIELIKTGNRAIFHFLFRENFREEV